MADPSLTELFARVPLGWTLVEVEGRRYGLTRTEQVGGRSQKVYAEELGGGDVVSANLYRPDDGGERFRPCEMPAEKVADFLRRWRRVTSP